MQAKKSDISCKETVEQKKKPVTASESEKIKNIRTALNEISQKEEEDEIRNRITENVKLFKDHKENPEKYEREERIKKLLAEKKSLLLKLLKKENRRRRKIVTECGKERKEFQVELFRERVILFLRFSESRYSGCLPVYLQDVLFFLVQSFTADMIQSRSMMTFQVSMAARKTSTPPYSRQQQRMMTPILRRHLRKKLHTR